MRPPSAGDDHKKHCITVCLVVCSVGKTKVVNVRVLGSTTMDSEITITIYIIPIVNVEICNTSETSSALHPRFSTRKDSQKT